MRQHTQPAPDIESTVSREPRFAVGDPVWIRGEVDRVIGRYPYRVAGRFRYGGATCWSWRYRLVGITGTLLTTAFEDQLEGRVA